MIRRHVVLIGLPGAGKSTVGALTADLLDAPFFDADLHVVERAGMPVIRIFHELGEPRFRELEREVMEDLLDDEPAVIAPGGGWAARSGIVAGVRERALVVYLETRPEVAARRAAGGAERPLLQGADPAERMAELLAEREAFYRRAERVVSANNDSPERVAERIADIARELAGW